MPIVRNGKVQVDNFGQLKLVFQDVARYLRTGRIPDWTKELEKAGVPRERVMSEVVLQTAENAVQFHERMKRDLDQENDPVPLLF